MYFLFYLERSGIITFPGNVENDPFYDPVSARCVIGIFGKQPHLFDEIDSLQDMGAPEYSDTNKLP